jgi:hypothetical protein
VLKFQQYDKMKYMHVNCVGLIERTISIYTLVILGRIKLKAR